MYVDDNFSVSVWVVDSNRHCAVDVTVYPWMGGLQWLTCRMRFRWHTCGRTFIVRLVWYVYVVGYSIYCVSVTMSSGIAGGCGFATEARYVWAWALSRERHRDLLGVESCVSVLLPCRWELIFSVKNFLYARAVCVAKVNSVYHYVIFIRSFINIININIEWLFVFACHFVRGVII